MADTVQTLSLLVLSQNYRGGLVKQINRRSALLRLLNIVPGEGKNVAWAAQGSGQVVETFAEGADATNFGSDSEAQAILSWGAYRSNFHVSGRARRAANTSRTPDGVQNLIGKNMVSSTEALVSKINVDLYTGDGTSNALVGLDVAIGDNTNTYATIDRTTSTYWQPYVADPGSATQLTMGQVRQDLGQIVKASGSSPDIAMVGVNTFNIVAALFDPTRRYVQNTQTVTTARGSVILDATYQTLEIDGCVFIRDKDATEGKIYYLNTNFVEVEYLPLDVPTMEAVEGVMAQMGTTMPANDGFGPFPLGLRAEKLAKNGDSDRYQVITELQLAVRRPNACGIRKNVA